ncbi:hypothetical protein D9M69_581200 [compost metagenome]
MPALAGQDVDHRHRLHATHAEQGIAQFLENLRAQRRGVDINIGRDHFHRIQVQIAPAEQGQDFLGDTDAVDEADVDTHGAVLGSAVRRVASMPWGGLMVKSCADFN